MRLRTLALATATTLVLAATAVLSSAAPAQAITASPLVNPVSGKCLDVDGGGTADGTPVQIWSCRGNANQSWTSTDAGELRATIGGVTKCLDATGGGTANGTRIVMWSCNGGANQQWTLAADETIRGVPSGKCVDINANGTADGTFVQLWTCKPAGDNNQRWRAGGGGPGTTNITINGAAGGRVLDGVGAISGGGGNSRLLPEYPQAQRSQILDYLFKPGYGSAVQILKLEIGGDANSTDGSEPSIEHTRGTVNCDVGYEFWLAKEAKARNPNIKLGGLAWAAPGWISNGADNYWHQDTIDYLIRWLDCARNNGLTIDYIGGRNEKGHNKAWTQSFRQALDSRGYAAVKYVSNDSVGWKVADDMQSDAAFKSAIDVVGVHYPCGYLKPATTCNSTANALATGRPLWASENGSQDIDSGAPQVIRGITRGYVDGRMTGYLHWPIVAAITPNLPFANVGLAVAPSPWSGFYRLGRTTWAIAHVTQFTQPGWRFVDSASGFLGGSRDNGSYISLKAPNGRDYSTIVEATTATQAQTVNVTLTGGLSTGTVRVWDTNLNSNSSSEHFIRKADVTPSGGRYSVTVQPGHVVSLTTTTGQGKGTATGPANHGLALPYQDSFESYPLNTMARYVADMQGIFEVRNCLNGRTGRCLQQVTPVRPIRWQANRDIDVYTLAGDPAWRDYTVSVDVNMQQAGTVKLLGRANTQNRNADKQAAYELRITDTGRWTLAKNDTVPVLTTLASGTTTAPGLRSWHTLTLEMRGDSITAKVDDRVLTTVRDGSYAAGQVGFGNAGALGYQTTMFDNLRITS
jgi:O-glycosyl hydrolase